MQCKHYSSDGTSAWRVVSRYNNCTFYRCLRCGATRTVC